MIGIDQIWTEGIPSLLASEGGLWVNFEGSIPARGLDSYLEIRQVIN